MSIGAAHGKAHPARAQMGHTPPSADWPTLAWWQSAKGKLEMATSRGSLVPPVAHQKAVNVVRSQLAKHYHLKTNS